MSKGETIVQVHAMGPFKVNWVNPAECSHRMRHQRQQTEVVSKP